MKPTLHLLRLTTRFLIPTLLVLTGTGCAAASRTQEAVPASPTRSATPTRTETPSPTGSATPLPSARVNPRLDPAEVLFPDGTRLVLEAGASIQVMQLSSGTIGASLSSRLPKLAKPALAGIDTVILINQGAVLALPGTLQTRLLILNLNGQTAAVQGEAMRVRYDPGTQEFQLDCISGNCEIGPKPDYLFSVPPGASLQYTGSSLGNPVPLDLAAFLAFYGPYLPEELASSIATLTAAGTAAAGTATPLAVDMNATATAACSSFQQQFPATPCP